MYAMSWREIKPNGSQHIQVKTFSSEKRRQDFIDGMTANGSSFQITSLSTADSHELSDFQEGMRVRIEKALHTELIGKEGTVTKTVKKDSMVCIKLDNGGSYRAFAWNLELA